MRSTTLFVSLMVLWASNSLAQAPTPAGVKIGFSTGYMFFGPLVPEVTHHVRLGNLGQDQYFEANVDKPLADDLGFVASMVVVPTQLYQWPKAGEIGRTWRPETASEMKVWNSTWSCLTLGLRHRPANWIEGSAGAGMCSVSGASYRQFGAAPMSSGTLQIGARVLKDITEGVSLDVSCMAYPSYSSRATGQPYTVYRVMSGYDDYNTGFWTTPVRCGAGLRVGD